jgi:hypothetical protein
MARGWESKSVESQMDSAAEDAALAHRIRKTPEQVDRESKLHALMLSRTRVLNDLKSALNPRYRVQLAQALAYLDQQIAAAGPDSTP